MADFLEKLKKGMDIKKMPDPDVEETKNLADLEGDKKIEEEAEEVSNLEEVELEEDSIDTSPKLETVTAQSASFAKSENKREKTKKKTKKPKIKKIKIKQEKQEKKEKKEEKEWLGSEGQLVVDLYQTNGEIVIQSAVGGVAPEDLDISIENDMVKIKGNREKTFERSSRNYFYRECHWGSFSREIILPVEVDAGRAEAIIKNGILTIRMPKIERVSKKKIRVKEKE